MAHPARSISGNILLYILGAIFLLGMLIILIKGSFQEGTGIDAEKTLIRVGEIQRYGAELERGVRYILQNGFSETELRFARDNVDEGYGVIADRPQRQVFSTEGGAVQYQLPPAGITNGAPVNWQFYGDIHIPDMGTDGGMSRSELIAVLPNLTQSFCSSINRTVGQNVDLAQDGFSACPGTPFLGIFMNEPATREVVATQVPKRPATEACLRCSDGTYNYYRVLLSR